jgi:hypothetical protein
MSRGEAVKIRIGQLRKLIRENLTTNAIATYPNEIEETEDANLEEDDGGGDSGGGWGGGDGWGWGMGGGMGGGGGHSSGFRDAGWSVDDINNRDLLDILFP